MFTVAVGHDAMLDVDFDCFYQVYDKKHYIVNLVKCMCFVPLQLFIKSVLHIKYEQLHVLHFIYASV